MTLHPLFLSCTYMHTLKKSNKPSLSPPRTLLPSTLSFAHMGLLVRLPSVSHICYLFSLVSFWVFPSVSLLLRLIWFSLSLNLSWGFGVSHSAHCVGSMCRLSPLRLGPYQLRQATRPLMKVALLSMLIQHQLHSIWIQLAACQLNEALEPWGWGSCDVGSLISLTRHFLKSVKGTSFLRLRSNPVGADVLN